MLLYLHGFTSGPSSHKARALGERMAQRGYGAQFICPQLLASPAASIRLASELVERHDVRMVVGSSLGGYYATWLTEHFADRRMEAVLVNPAVVAHLSLARYLGPQRWLYSGEPFEFTPAHIEELRAMSCATLAHPERYWLLVETGDETLDYRHAVARYQGARQMVLTGGDHSFTRWGVHLDSIIDQWQRLYPESQMQNAVMPARPL